MACEVGSVGIHRLEVWNTGRVKGSILSPPPLFFVVVVVVVVVVVLWFAFSIIHRSEIAASVYYTECKPKEKKNWEAWERGQGKGWG